MSLLRRHLSRARALTSLTPPTSRIPQYRDRLLARPVPVIADGRTLSVSQVSFDLLEVKTPSMSRRFLTWQRQAGEECGNCVSKDACGAQPFITKVDNNPFPTPRSTC